MIADIRKDRETGMAPKHGNWFWHGQPDSMALATEYGGRRYVMDFVRKGMKGAQPRFQTDGLMHNAADDLATFSVGEGHVRGHRQAKEDPTVYRYDISGIDHPDARRIARVPEMEELILSLEAQLTEAHLAEDGAMQIIAAERAEVLSLRKQLTEAKAREAVAYEVAANSIQKAALDSEQGHEIVDICIRALTPTHTTTALEQIKQEARDEGKREILARVIKLCNQREREWDLADMSNYANAAGAITSSISAILATFSDTPKGNSDE
ncbi:hypothetical protein JQV16_08595 [Sulfitobacter mediterraneus]|nr:hypothetical protein [Sulfitobacter mediterraneus]